MASFAPTGLVASLAVLASLQPLLAAQTAPAPAPAPAVSTPAAIVAAAPASAWRTVPPDRLLVMDMADGRRLLIELAPQFAPIHVRNIVRLARAGWWEGAAIVRVQDDYVVQWSRMPEAAPKEDGFVPHPPAEYERALAGLAFRPLPYPDPYAPRTGFADGWPVGTDGRQAWLAHCYGAVGVGRDMPP
ncbi:MAG: peptidylprolyl isomerase, partial [Gluconacetobacter diazotrophicus]|nr:peptidylprolyl isomerase [Gluconacetobacter diazotrophicus]